MTLGQAALGARPLGASVASPVTVRQLADTAASVGDAAAALTLRQLADAAAAMSDSVGVGRGNSRAVADTGAAVAAVLARQVGPALADYLVARPPLQDSFSRTVANGWGTSDSGDAWTRQTGVASEYSVNGSAAQLATAVTNSSRYATVGPTLPPDVDVVVRLALSAVPVAQSTVAAVIARWQGVNDHLRAWLSWTTGGAVQLRLEKISGGTITVLTTQPNVVTGYAPGSFVWVRLQALGTTLRTRAWLDGSAEPSTWTHSITDPEFRNGGPVGIRLFHTTGNTAVPTLSVDDLTVTAAMSDSLLPTLRRPLSDAASSAGDALSPVERRALADAAASLSEALALVARPRIADVAAAVVASLAARRSSQLADVAAATSTALALRVGLRLADTLAALTDQVGATGDVSASDVIASLVDVAFAVRVMPRSVADAMAMTDEIVRLPAFKSVALADVILSLVEALEPGLSPGLVRWPSRLELARSRRRLVVASPARLLVVQRRPAALAQARGRGGVVRPLVYRP